MSIWVTCDRFQTFKMCPEHYDQQVTSLFCISSQALRHPCYILSEIHMRSITHWRQEAAKLPNPREGIISIPPTTTPSLQVLKSTPAHRTPHLILEKVGIMPPSHRSLTHPANAENSPTKGPLQQQPTHSLHQIISSHPFPPPHHLLFYPTIVLSLLHSQVKSCQKRCK